MNWKIHSLKVHVYASCAFVDDVAEEGCFHQTKKSRKFNPCYIFAYGSSFYPTTNRLIDLIDSSNVYQEKCCQCDLLAESLNVLLRTSSVSQRSLVRTSFQD